MVVRRINIEMIERGTSKLAYPLLLNHFRADQADADRCLHGKRKIRFQRLNHFVAVTKSCIGV